MTAAQMDCRRIQSWAACSAVARVGQGMASQLGMSPVGEVIFLDPLLE